MPRYFGPCGEIIINIAGAGEGFIAEEVSGQLSLASGASGDIITLTPPSGKRVRLDMLNSNTGESGLTVTVSGNVVINSLNLAGSAAALSTGDFRVGLTGAPGTSEPRGNDSSVLNLVTSNSNDTIVIAKDTGSTTSTITYSYSYGD
jgi:hypothetical protein